MHSPRLWNEPVLTPKMPQQESSAQWTPCCLFDQEITISPGGPWRKLTSTASRWLESSPSVCSAQLKLCLNPLSLHSSEISESMPGEAGIVNTFHTEGTLKEPEKSAKPTQLDEKPQACCWGAEDKNNTYS